MRKFSNHPVRLRFATARHPSIRLRFATARQALEGNFLPRLPDQVGQ
ncbi:MAG: hypothetical protein LBB23_01895 [Rickettsiales bacterium]|nr:hypothetical protein [Rickettsiales bacterium]